MIFSAKLRLFHQIRNKFSTYRTYLENFYLLRYLLLCFCNQLLADAGRQSYISTYRTRIEKCFFCGIRGIRVRTLSVMNLENLCLILHVV